MFSFQISVYLSDWCIANLFDSLLNLVLSEKNDSPTSPMQNFPFLSCAVSIRSRGKDLPFVCFLETIPCVCSITESYLISFRFCAVTDVSDILCRTNDTC